MWSIYIDIFVYVDQTYRDMNSYLKGLHLTLDSWRPHREKEGWKIQGEQLKMSEMGGKWNNVEKVDRPSLVKGVPMLMANLKALRHLIEKKNPPKRKLRVKMQELAYRMGYARGLGSS